MTPDDRDPKIRGWLAEAHRADAAPPFESTWASARAGTRRRPLRWALAFVATAAVAAAVTVSRLGPAHIAPARPLPELPRWTSPTDFLLDVPGLAFLEATPALRPWSPPYVGGADAFRKETLR